MELSSPNCPRNTVRRRSGPITDDIWLNYCHSQGNLVYLELFGQPIVVVNSHDVAIDLLEKRSVNYSDRPRSVMSEL